MKDWEVTEIEKKRWRAAGRQMMKGALDEVANVCLAIIIFLIAYQWLAEPVDDCDRSAWDRCGAKVITDHKTGVQYLEGEDGGLIVREERRK